MINLLPPDLKQEYRFARMNTHLRHWIIGALCGLAGLAALAVFGVLYINHNISSYQTTIAANKSSLEAQRASEITAKTTAMSNNLSLMLKVLSKEVLWADLLNQIARVTPNNVSLTQLSISQTENAIDISAGSKTYASGTQLYTNLNDPANQLFSKADLNSVTCQTPSSGSGSSASGGVTLSPGSGGAYNSGSTSSSSTSSSGTGTNYPCNVSIRALLVQDSPFLFTSSKGTTK